MPLVLLLIFVSSQVYASELYQHFQSVRALGMGGVYVYDESDAGVIFKNPAGLGQINGFNLTLFNIDAGVNGLQIYNDLQSISNMSGLSSLSALYGKNVWLGADAYTSFAIPYFGFAVFDNASTGFRLDNPAYPNMTMSLLNDYGYSIAGALPIAPNLYFGLGFKRLTRLGGTQVFGGTSLNNTTNSQLASSFQNTGYAYGLDTGLHFVAPAPFSPTLSLSWMDAGATTFIKTAGNNAPARIEDNLTAAFTFNGDVPLLGFSGGFEYRHIKNNSEPLGKKLHMGVELSVAMFDVRAGFYQGYTTYGVGLDLLFMQLDAAMYSVEKGAYAGQTPDQRIEIRLISEISFDPSFSIMEFGSTKKRKLKQRR